MEQGVRKVWEAGNGKFFCEVCSIGFNLDKISEQEMGQYKL